MPTSKSEKERLSKRAINWAVSRIPKAMKAGAIGMMFACGALVIAPTEARGKTHSIDTKISSAEMSTTPADHQQQAKAAVLSSLSSDINTSGIDMSSLNMADPKAQEMLVDILKNLLTPYKDEAKAKGFVSSLMEIPDIKVSLSHLTKGQKEDLSYVLTKALSNFARGDNLDKGIWTSGLSVIKMYESGKLDSAQRALQRNISGVATLLVEHGGMTPLEISQAIAPIMSVSSK